MNCVPKVDLENLKNPEKQVHTNRLINENSPYLLQHAHNPVNWYPWSKEAFKIAIKHDKPVFLSIGYSTCHWCHVMERESFCDESTAKILNDNFICIKVDREERPDIDALYMNVVQLMTGRGGWPLSLFLGPKGEPFYGGTYFPPNEAYGLLSFKQLLLTIAEAWKNKRDILLESADKIKLILADQNEQIDQESLSPDILDKAKLELEITFDSVNGGFGIAPKFPQPSNLSMLLAYWNRTRDNKVLEMVEKTLKAMARGGIYDHLGGGFHRYSTDSQWLVPHFEKMLYDQALLSKVYVQAYQITNNNIYANVAKKIFDYVLNDMTDSKGGFYSAEDAESEGKEGTFYMWESSEIETILSADQANVFNNYYGINKSGNFEDGKSILNISKTTKNLGKKFKKTRREIENILSISRSRLLEHRAKRIRPYRDDKIIAGWNGLMISSLAYGGATLNCQSYVRAAEMSAGFILETLINKDGLKRYFRNGEMVGCGFLDDYAFMIMGLLDLYEATFDIRWFVEAKKLAEQMINLFGDKNGAFNLNDKANEHLIVYSQSSYDGAVPSGNSIAALVLLKLGRLMGKQYFTDKGVDILNAFSQQMVKSPTSLCTMLTALDFYIGPVQEIIIAGKHQEKDTLEIIRLIQSKFLPNAVILFHQDQETDSAIGEIVPFIKYQTAINGKATVYVCQNYTCKQPVQETEALEKILSDVTTNKAEAQ